MERDLELSGGDNNDGYFNSHAHVERDRCVADKHTIIKNFNSHAHVERDAALSSSCIYSLNFNSHAHVERDEGV